MKFELLPAVLVVLGWAIHFGMSWGEVFKTEKTSLKDYVAKNPPAFIVSVLSVVAAYLIGPDILEIVGVSLPENDGLKALGAFAVGYFADSFVYKMANLSKKAA